MGLLCKNLERCNWCPPRAPRVRCWWIITTSYWRLCASCYEYATGETPDRAVVS